ncbi:PREDICTED: proteoglycan 4 [Condylura cristata]|uniref:proteoglycan 4 n=1 Tax=Condylura cristata TaxID=143302 RepID=UPI000643C9F2|nr:PREDICTED: proteoglycan 4 [Condylura cristata]
MEWKMLPVHLMLLLSVLLIQQVSSQDLSSCAGRCGEGYSRDAICNCDYNCQHYMECCPDFKKVCTEELSCKGRCFESFVRGRECDCDAQCTKFGKCCPDYKEFCEELHKPTSPPSPKTAPPPPEASQTIKSTSKRSPKSPNKKKTKKVVESEEITEAKDKKKAPEKKPKPEPPAVDEPGSGLDNVTPKPDIPTTKSSKVTTLPKITTVKPTDPKPTVPSNSATDSKETTIETKETSTISKQTSASAKEKKTTSTKEIRSAEKPSDEESAPTSEIPTEATSKAETTTKVPAPPTTPKEPEPATPEEPEPTKPKETALVTSEASTPTTPVEPPKKPAEPTPKLPAEPIPKATENSPKQPAVPTPKAPKVTKPQMTTAKDKTTEKEKPTTPEITTAAPKITTKETTAAEEAMEKPEETTVIPKATTTDSKVTTSKRPKPTKAPRKPKSTRKPRVKKPKTTPTPAKMTTTPVPETTPASTTETTVQTTTIPIPTPTSKIVEINPKDEDADAAEGDKPEMIPSAPLLTPMGRPGSEFLAGGHNQDIEIKPMLSDETDLCNGKPVDAVTTLRNGTLVAFRGHYFWMLRPFTPPPPPRRITEVWGIPSPIDTVFTRCNCEGKTYFFKDSQYWRFTNDVKDAGYPKQIVKGFGGLNGKIVGALSVAKYMNRPESVYFFKRGGGVQQYTYKQEPARKCPGRRPAVNYSVYGQTTQVRRRRFERAIGPPQTHTIRIHYSPVRVTYQDKGFLHNEVRVSTMWRGLPNLVTSAIALPNIRKPDGYDYYAFSKNQYYNIDVPSRTARAVTTRSGQTLSKAWYNCP